MTGELRMSVQQAGSFQNYKDTCGPWLQEMQILRFEAEEVGRRVLGVVQDPGFNHQAGE